MTDELKLKVDYILVLEEEVLYARSYRKTF